MDRTFDYTQTLLVAVEFAEAPTHLPSLPPTYSVFQRLPIPEILQAFEQTESQLARLIAGRKFRSVLERHMGYWEQRVPAGKHCYVHYAIGTSEVIDEAFLRLRSAADWIVFGTYHLEPQCSAYPYAFPTHPSPNQWHLDALRGCTSDSVFWFNFFPAQPHLFLKTFAVWVLFNGFQDLEGCECNQLVASEGPARLFSSGVDPFVQVNLNRFTSLTGFWNSAREAGKNTFTVDPEYTWYGMLLKRLASASAGSVTAS